MYFEGNVEGNTTFFLEGVIFVGDIELPRLSSGQSSMNSVFPYTDFKNPV